MLFVALYVMSRISNCNIEFVMNVTKYTQGTKLIVYACGDVCGDV